MDAPETILYSASSLATASFRCTPIPIGDGSVGLADFAAFRSAFGKHDQDAGFLDYLDANRDGTIGLTDFAAFRSSFGNQRPNDFGE